MRTIYIDFRRSAHCVFAGFIFFIVASVTDIFGLTDLGLGSAGLVASICMLVLALLLYLAVEFVFKLSGMRK